eukprot:4588948-Prymnesium_polylepis.1
MAHAQCVAVRQAGDELPKVAARGRRVEAAALSDEGEEVAAGDALEHEVDALARGEHLDQVDHVGAAHQLQHGDLTFDLYGVDW